MNTAHVPQSPRSRDPHVASLAHDGRLWTAFLEFADPDPSGRRWRARLRFEAADAADAEEPARTTYLIIEDSPEAALQRARGFDERQLEGLLRSALPEPPAQG